MVYRETFYPNFDPDSDFGPCRGFQAARDDRYKYIRRFDGVGALYDLTANAWE